MGCPGDVLHALDYEIYQIPTRGGQAQRRTDDRLPDYDPAYSPDGRRLAWLTNIPAGASAGIWDIRVREPNGVCAGWW